MGIWNTIRKSIFGSGGGRDAGLYFYVKLYTVPNKPSPQDEIVRIRINAHNDLSQTDEGQYFVRKVVVGNKHMRRGEVLLYFDKNYRLKDSEVQGGELVNKTAYEAYLAQVE